MHTTLIRTPTAINLELFISSLSFFHWVRTSYPEPHAYRPCTWLLSHPFGFSSPLIFNFLDGVGISLFGIPATIWPTAPALDVRWWVCGSCNENYEGKAAPVPLCSPQIPHDMTCDRTWAAAVGSWPLTSWAMTQASLSHIPILEHISPWKEQSK
jgi:hypothetical protein